MAVVEWAPISKKHQLLVEILKKAIAAQRQKA